MKNPSESVTLNIYRISMKLIICIIYVNSSAYAKIEKDPPNGCDPDYMDHGIVSMGSYIHSKTKVAVTGLNNFKFYRIYY